MAERIGEAHAISKVARVIVARLFDFSPQPELEFARRFLGESDGDNPAELGASAGERRDDSLDQRGGLAGSGRGLNYQHDVEVVADSIAHALVRDVSRYA